MKPVCLDSMDHVENIDTKCALVGKKISTIARLKKKNFCKLLLDCLLELHEIVLRSSSDNQDQKLVKYF